MKVFQSPSMFKGALLALGALVLFLVFSNAINPVGLAFSRWTQAPNDEAHSGNGYARKDKQFPAACAEFSGYGMSTSPPVFSYAPSLSNPLGSPITSIAPTVIGSSVPSGQTVGDVSTFSTDVSGPRGMVMDALGNLYVAETGGKRISRFDPNGTKSVIRQFASFEPVDITIDANTGDLYATIATHRILWIPNTNKANYPAQQPTHVWTNDATNVFAGASTSGTTDASGTNARFNAPAGIVMSPDNTYLLVAENGSHRIRRVALSNRAVTTYAGSTSSGTADGNRTTTARFNNPEGVHFGKDGNIYVTEWSGSNHRIRKISGDDVSTLAGGTLGLFDGSGTDARFERPRGITSDAAGNLYVVEGNNNVVRKVTPTGMVSVLAGSLAGGYNSTTTGTTDGVGYIARFNAPRGAYFAPDGFLYVADNSGNRIRKISISGWQLLNPLPAGMEFNSNSGQISGTPATYTYTPHYFSAFDSSSLEKDGNDQSVTLAGTANVRGGMLYLTGLANSQNGTLVIEGKGQNQPGLRTDFTLTTTKNSGSAAGVSYSFGPSLNQNTAGAAEIGVGSGLSLSFNTSIGGIRLYYGANKSQSSTAGTGGLLAINTANNTWRGRTAQVSLEVTWDGKASVWLDGTLIFDKIQLPSAFLEQQLSSWNHVLRGATGGSANDIHAIDNLSIAQGYGTGTYRVRAANSNGVHTASLDFSLQSVPGVSTIKVYDIAHNSAKVDFYTPFTGGSAIIKQGVIWGTTPGLELPGALGSTMEALDLDTLTSTLMNLTGGTTYYVRAYAENALGVSYGIERSFTTPLAPPSVAYNSNRVILQKDQSAAFSVINSGGAVPDGFPNVVSTLAGSTAGFADGQGSAARMNIPVRTAVDASGNIYVADQANHRIRKITPDGLVSTLAGSGTTGGFADGQGAAARFNQPTGVALDAAGNIYVADQFNHRIRKITPGGLVSTLAGSGTPGFADGQVNDVQFNRPHGVAVDAAGMIYVADSDNHRIRKINTEDGWVSTLAGRLPGYADGQGDAARLTFPTDVALDMDGNVYVADQANHRIRKITPTGLVSTLAGSGPPGGFADGQGTTARFNLPFGITVDAASNVYVADHINRRIRKISPDGLVSTLAGSGAFGVADGQGATAQFNLPIGLVVDAYGNIYVADSYNNRIRKISTAGWSISPALPAGLVLNTDGSISGTPTALSAEKEYTLTATNGGGTGTFTFSLGVAEIGLASLTASAGVLSPAFATDKTSYTVNIGSAVHAVTFTATELFEGSDIQWKLGQGSFASISSGTASPSISLEEGDNLVTIEVRGGGKMLRYTVNFKKATTPPDITYVPALSLTLNVPVESLEPRNTGGSVPAQYSNVVRTVAGSTAGFWGASSGSADGQGTNARFNAPTDVAIDAAGNIFVSDAFNSRIRKITPDGWVSTLAGSTQGFADGQGTGAQFATPISVVVDAAGNVYVADQNNVRIRKITPDGLVSTLAGSSIGFADGQGTNAKFGRITGIALDAAGNLYAADFDNHRIRKITPEGLVSTLAGSGPTYGQPGGGGFANGQGDIALFYLPNSVAVDAAGNVYVSDRGNNLIRKIAPDGLVSTLAGSTRGFMDGQGAAAKFDSPLGISVDEAGNVYVVDFSNYRIRKITPTGLVSTVAGSSSQGFLDGPAIGPRFGSPFGVDLDAGGNVYVADLALNKILKISTSGWTIAPALPAGLVLNTDGSITGTPTALSPAQDYVITAVNSGGSSSYTISIEVTAGATEGLKSLTLSQGALKPAFNSETLQYSVQVASGVSTISFVPTAVNASAQLRLNGSPIANATTTGTLNLNIGPNTFNFLVKETGGKEITYTVVVTRALPPATDDIVWKGTVGKQWSVGGNWQGNSRPASGADVKFSPTASNDLEVDEDITSGTIDFNGSNKKVVLVNNDLTVSGFAGRTASNFVEVTGAGRLTINIGANLKALYPVGNQTYTPIAITNKTGQAAAFSVGLYTDVFDQGTLGSPIPNARIQRTWDIGNATSAVGGSGIDLEFSWTAAEDTGVKNPALYHFTGGAWVKLDAAKTTVDLSSRILLYKGYTGSLSPFAIYDELPTETQLTISAPTLTKTKGYDGTTTAVVTAGTLSGVAAGDDVTVSATATYDNALPGSGKTIRVVYTLGGTDASGYIKPADAVFIDGEITRIPLTATPAAVTTSKVYDGTTSAAATAGTLSGVLTGETVGLIARAAYDNATAGSGKTITVSYTLNGPSAGNYLAPPDETIPTGEITRAALSVAVKPDAKFVGQADPSGYAGATFTGFVNGETESALTGTLLITRSNAAVNTTGNYAGVLLGSGLSAQNYTLTFQPGDFSILPADVLLVKLGPAASIYGEDPEYTISSAGYFSSSEQELVDLTSSAFISGTSIQVSDGFELTNFELDVLSPQRSTSGNLKVGNYTMGATGVELSSNVTALRVLGTLQVSRRTLLATLLGATSKTYDGTRDMSGISVQTSGILADDVVAATFSTALYDGASAGPQPFKVDGIAVSGTDAENYSIQADLTDQGQISPKVLAVTGTSVTKVKAYDGSTGAAVSLGAVSGILNQDVVAVQANAAYLDKFAGTNKTITLTYTLEGPAASNYTAPAGETFTDGAITRKTLDITPPSVVLRKAYDGTRNAAVEPGSLLGLIAGDQIAVFASALYDNAAVGTGKTITVTYSLEGADTINYTTALMDFVTNEGEIFSTTPVQLLVTEPQLTLSKTYDGSATAAVQPGDLIGLASGAAVQVLATATYDNAQAGTSKLITVQYTLSGADAGSYLAPPDYTVSSGTILAVALTIQANDASKLFDGQPFSGGNGVTYQGFILNESETELDGTLTYGGTSQGAIDPGTYTITPAGLTATNYTITFSDGTLTITAPACSNPTSGGEIEMDQTVCSNETPESITNKTTPSGQTGELEYQWQASVTSATTGFSDIADATAADYQPGLIAQNTWFIRRTKATCASTWLESNTAAITVKAAPTVSTTTVDYPTFGISNGSATASVSGGASPVSLIWSNGATTSTITGIPFGDYSVTATGSNGCSSTATAEVQPIIRGTIRWSADPTKGVNGASILQTGSATGSENTTANGSYAFAPVTPGNYLITPKKTANLLNGVTAADATRIQRSSVLLDTLKPPFELIAADVNGSGSITSVDGILIGQCIANNPAACSKWVSSWRFVDAAHTFANPKIPWGFPESIALTPSTIRTGNGLDFIGIKVGDISNPKANPQLRPQPVVFRGADIWIEEGTVFDMPVRVHGYHDIAAFQVELEFDPEFLTLEALDLPEAGLLTTDNLGLWQVQEGSIRLVRAELSGETLEDDSLCFTLTFKALQGGKWLSELIAIQDAHIPAEAYTDDLAPQPIIMELQRSTSTGAAATAPVQLSAIPNPANEATQIRFTLPEDTYAQIRLLDIAGRVIRETAGTYSAGMHQERLELPQQGIFIVEIRTPMGSASLKIISTRM